MKASQTLCPYCGNDKIYQTRREGVFEQFVSTFNFFPHCCFNCNKRFLVRISLAIDSKSPNRVFKILPVKKRIILSATILILAASLVICFKIPGRLSSKQDKNAFPSESFTKMYPSLGKNTITNETRELASDSHSNNLTANIGKEITEDKGSITIMETESNYSNYQGYSINMSSLSEASPDIEEDNSSNEIIPSTSILKIQTSATIKKSYLEKSMDSSLIHEEGNIGNDLEISKEDTISMDKDLQNTNRGFYPWTSTRFLNKLDLVNLSPGQLKIMRNEIFARHSYIFTTKEMREYFEQQPWYTPLQKDVSKDLSEIEVHNLNLLNQAD